MARLFDDGQAEYLEIDSVAVTDPPFAIAARFYDDALVASETIFYIGDKDTENDRHGLYIKGDAAGDYLRAYSKAANFQYAETTTGATINTWHHGCGIWAATDDRRVLIDGGSKGTNAVGQAVAGIDRMSIGRAGKSIPTYYWSGRLAEVAVWDLTNWPGATGADKGDAFEAIALPALAAGYSPLFFMLGLAAYWPLIRDEDQDRVGGYDMTAYNTPSIAAHPPVIYPAPAMLGLTAAGGITYYETPVGTFTSSGALARLAAATKAGTFASSGAIVRQTATSKAGTLTSSGTLVRQAQKAMAGAFSSAGALVRQTGKSVAGTLSSVGAVIKQTATSKAGTLTTSGTLSTIRTFLRTVAGTLSTSGALARQTSKSVAGTLSSVGAVIKRVAKSLAGALGLAGVLARYLLGWVPGDQTVTCLIVTETVTGEVTGVSVTGEVTEVAVTDEVV